MAAGATLTRIVVRASPTNPARGILVAGPDRALRSRADGVTRHKREGDGATPAGPLRFVSCQYRPDRAIRPATMLPISGPIRFSRVVR